MIKKYNYVIHVIGRSKNIYCNTKEEVWTELEKLSLGACYEVTSQTGKSTRIFIPF